MNWVSLALFIAALAVVVYLYRESQSTAAVADKYQTSTSDDGLSAIEYFWRPG